MSAGLAEGLEGAAPAPAEARGRRGAGSGSRVLAALAGLAGLFLVWWIGTELLPAQASFVRRFSPVSAFTALGRLATASDLLHHVVVSLRRVAVGLGCALAIGVPLGLAVGRFRLFDAATAPAFQFLRMISPLSWMPIAVMVFGVGDRPIYFLLAFAALWPILLNTAAGVRRLDPLWLQIAQSLSATRWEALTGIILPGVLGQVLTGVRLAIGIVWIVLVPCEMLGVSAGLGYFILDTRDRLAYDELAATVLVIGLLGFLLDAAARLAARLWDPGA